MNNGENKRPCGLKQQQDLAKRYEKGLLERLEITIEPFFGGFHVNLKRPSTLREFSIDFRIFRGFRPIHLPMIYLQRQMQEPLKRRKAEGAALQRRFVFD